MRQIKGQKYKHKFKIWESVNNKLILKDQLKQIINIILNTLLFTHIASCFWAFLLVGNSQKTNWLDGFYDYSKRSENPSSQRIYLIGFYWAISTISTVGLGDIRPVTIKEVIFCIIFMVFGVWLFSNTIGAFQKVFTDPKNVAVKMQYQVIVELHKMKLLDKTMLFKITEAIEEYYNNVNSLKVSTKFGILKTIYDKQRIHMLSQFFDGNMIKNKFFEGCDKEFIAQIAPILTHLIVKAGDFVYNKDQPPIAVFLLLKGRVNFLHRRKTNMKSIVEDSYFGEIEVFKNCARLFSVRAQVDTQLLVLRRDQFLDVLENFPEIKKIFLARSLLKAFNIKMCFIKNDRLSWIPKDSEFFNESPEVSSDSSSEEAVKNKNKTLGSKNLGGVNPKSKFDNSFLNSKVNKGNGSHRSILSKYNPSEVASVMNNMKQKQKLAKQNPFQLYNHELGNDSIPKSRKSSKVLELSQEEEQDKPQHRNIIKFRQNSQHLKQGNQIDINKKSHFSTVDLQGESKEYINPTKSRTQKKLSVNNYNQGVGSQNGLTLGTTDVPDKSRNNFSKKDKVNSRNLNQQAPVFASNSVSPSHEEVLESQKVESDRNIVLPQESDREADVQAQIVQLVDSEANKFTKKIEVINTRYTNNINTMIGLHKKMRSELLNIKEGMENLTDNMHNLTSEMVKADIKMLGIKLKSLIRSFGLDKEDGSSGLSNVSDFEEDSDKKDRKKPQKNTLKTTDLKKQLSENQGSKKEIKSEERIAYFKTQDQNKAAILGDSGTGRDYVKDTVSEPEESHQEKDPSNALNNSRGKKSHFFKYENSPDKNQKPPKLSNGYQKPQVPKPKKDNLFPIQSISSSKYVGDSTSNLQKQDLNLEKSQELSEESKDSIDITYKGNQIAGNDLRQKRSLSRPSTRLENVVHIKVQQKISEPSMITENSVSEEEQIRRVRKSGRISEEIVFNEAHQNFTELQNNMRNKFQTQHAESPQKKSMQNVDNKPTPIFITEKKIERINLGEIPIRQEHSVTPNWEQSIIQKSINITESGDPDFMKNLNSKKRDSEISSVNLSGDEMDLLEFSKTNGKKPKQSPYLFDSNTIKNLGKKKKFERQNEINHSKRETRSSHHQQHEFASNRTSHIFLKQCGQQQVEQYFIM